ncbi:MAG TPA: hypothetical protein VFH22_10655, partial [Rhodocyclaceae bacterium]|nr:hypothetical protein [Rhodocyclaceae bacterium]
MNSESSGKLPLHRRLSFRVLVPIVGFTVLLGVATFGYSLYTLSRFADQQAETSLRLHANTVRQIADDHLEKPHLTHGGEQDGRSRRIEALLTIEDFARANGLQIQILDRSNQRRIALGDLGVELPAGLAAPAGEAQSFVVGERRFQTHTVAFAPWNWEVSLVGDTQAYVALKKELLRGAGVVAAALVVATLLFLVYLVSLTQRPTNAIIDDLNAGRPPRYKGIAEFEFLGQSIAGMMQELLEKSQALERYRDHLEQLVNERTAELTAANSKLQDLNHELESSHRQLLQSEKLAAIGQLAAGVAHEINNPIGFVNSNLGVLGKYVQGLIRVVDA